MDIRTKAIELLTTWRGDAYIFGLDVMPRLGTMVASVGTSALLIANISRTELISTIRAALSDAGVKLVRDDVVPGAAPNSPTDDVYRIANYIALYKPDCIVVAGGGSQIDAVKAANVVASLGVHSIELEEYFGTNLVSNAMAKSGRSLLPLIAVETASSSGSHLTKYSNVTNMSAGQKKLIIDDAIVPTKALFDYKNTVTMPRSLTIDGILDGFGHCLEVFYGASEAKYEQIESISLTAISLLVKYAKRAIENPFDLEAREAIGLATDLGGYAIMVGGTNGAHLTSFSLVDVTTHGRACGIMNPYYTVLFSPAIQHQLRLVGRVLADNGYGEAKVQDLSGRELGLAVAREMIAFTKSLGSPTKLSELPGFSAEHVEKALTAAKNPQLASKLQNMPIPLTSDSVEEYMGPVLRAAISGDFGIIKEMNV